MNAISMFLLCELAALVLASATRSSSRSIWATFTVKLVSSLLGPVFELLVSPVWLESALTPVERSRAQGLPLAPALALLASQFFMTVARWRLGEPRLDVPLYSPSDDELGPDEVGLRCCDRLWTTFPFCGIKVATRRFFGAREALEQVVVCETIT